MAASQAGLGALQFDPTTGQLTSVGTGTGIAGYQPFLDQAATDINAASAAAAAGQGAGAGALGQAGTAMDAAQQAAFAGQDAGAQFMGPQAYQQFMSPYQQDVVDTTLASYDQSMAEQQAQLGASAGSAFGGGRFGVAQGELGAQGATGIAQTLAGLRQTGFEQARQGAADALQQQLALGQAAQGQAGQNLALLGSGLQGQLATSQAAQQQAAAAGTTLGGIAGLTGAPTATQTAAFTSPFQQQVIDTTLAEFDRQQAINEQNIRDQAAQIGALGAGRTGVQLSEFQSQSGRDRAALEAQLRQQGFQQAQAARQQDIQNRFGLAQAQSGLGQFQTGLAQQVPALQRADVSTLGQVGAAQQAQRQAVLDLSLIHISEPTRPY